MFSWVCQTDSYPATPKTFTQISAIDRAGEQGEPAARLGLQKACHRVDHLNARGERPGIVDGLIR